MRTLYNHYIPDDAVYSRIPDHEPKYERQHHQKPNFFQFFQQEKAEKNAGLSGIFKHFKLEDIDIGDILLLLIIVCVVLEGENWELAIILGLVLFLSMGKDDDAV